MMFNMGGTKFTKANWPSFYDAINKHDWSSAAKESHRSSGDIKRNNWARDTLLGIKENK